MRLDIIKGRSGYRIISYTTRKHPLLVHLATCLKAANKISPIKCGIYSISGGQFTMKKRVYSYTCDRVEMMGKKKYYSFIKGEATFKGKKSFGKIINLTEIEHEDLSELVDV